MADSIANNNKRLAKNTLYLYFRMALLMCIGLYTSRVILNTLGVEDYGIYNAVGGVIAIFNIIQGTFSTSTQRFITFVLGKNDPQQLNRVFSTSVIIHIAIALIIAIFAETLGLWFLYNKMQIPADRMFAAFWVFQCVIISTVVMIISVPYNALIIAHEKMGVFAKISLFEAFAKLFLVLMLKFVPLDKLIVYAITLVTIQLIVRLFYTQYCKKNYKESHVTYKYDRSLIKDMSKFAGWSLVGNTAFITYTQGLNILLNTFFGPAVNAARGIAVNVQGHVLQLITGFQTAINPQITKTYAAGELKYMHELIFRSSKFSYLLMLVISLPIIIEAPAILYLWLGNVPENTVIFLRIILMSTLINTIANPLITSIKATGNIKVYEIVVGGLMLAILPISYVFLRLGYPPYTVFLVHLVIEIIAQNARILIVGKNIKLTYLDFVKKIIVRIAIITVLCSILPAYLHFHYCHNTMSSMVNCAVTVVYCIIIVYMLGLNKNEKRVITRFILKKIKRNA